MKETVLKPVVYFVVGGPGSGKSTQCKFLSQFFSKLIHLSTGDLFRAEVKKKSEYSDIIEKSMKQGILVPLKISCILLKNEMINLGWDVKLLRKTNT